MNRCLTKMADHSELVSEMPVLEKLSTQERLKLARKRRTQQLKKWSQREKEYNNKRRKSEPKSNVKKNEYKVHFVPSVMLLEAAARNDVEEGLTTFYHLTSFCSQIDCLTKCLKIKCFQLFRSLLIIIVFNPIFRCFVSILELIKRFIL